jgi:hypothetical protein
MDTSAVDFPALALMLLAAGAIVGAIGVGGRTGDRRGRWMGAAAITVVLMAVALLDLRRETPRETHLATVFIGIPLPVLGAMATQRLARRTRPWVRWAVVFAVTFVLLLSGLLIGAAIAPRFLP